MKRSVAGLFSLTFLLVGVGSSEGAMLNETSIDVVAGMNISVGTVDAPVEVARRCGYGGYYGPGYRRSYYRGYGGYGGYGYPRHRHYHGYRPYYGPRAGFYIGF